MLRGLPLVVGSIGYSSCRAWASHCSEGSREYALNSRSCVDSKVRASVVVVHELKRTLLCGTFPDQGLNTSPALAGRFTAPPRKAPYLYFKVRSLRPREVKQLI